MMFSNPAVPLIVHGAGMQVLLRPIATALAPQAATGGGGGAAAAAADDDERTERVPQFRKNLMMELMPNVLAALHNPEDTRVTKETKGLDALCSGEFKSDKEAVERHFRHPILSADNASREDRKKTNRNREKVRDTYNRNKNKPEVKTMALKHLAAAAAATAATATAATAAAEVEADGEAGIVVASPTASPVPSSRRRSGFRDSFENAKKAIMELIKASAQERQADLAAAERRDQVNQNDHARRKEEQDRKNAQLEVQHERNLQLIKAQGGQINNLEIKTTGLEARADQQEADTAALRADTNKIMTGLQKMVSCL